MKKCNVLMMALLAALMIGGTAYADDDVMCAQVITYGQNPETLEWAAFSTPCDVPEGWRTAAMPPEDGNTNADTEIPVIAPYDGTDDNDAIPLIMPFDPALLFQSADGSAGDDMLVIAPAPSSDPALILRPVDDSSGKDIVVIAPAPFTEADNGTTVTLNTTVPFQVVLESNPSTGYEWLVITIDKDVLKLESSSFDNSECAEGVVGCGGKETWNFTTANVGTTTLEMAYFRPWENADSAAKSFTLTVEVVGDNTTSCETDLDGNGVVDKEDLNLKDAEMEKVFREWIENCWVPGEACGDFDGNGKTDRFDVARKELAIEKEFKQWKKSCWLLKVKTQSVKSEPTRCGGIAGFPCPEDQFCKFDENTCNWADNMGVCTPIPEFCIEIYHPVCGCDGKTYGNDCFLMMAGQSEAYDGICKE